MNFKGIAFVLITAVFFFQLFMKWLSFQAIKRPVPKNVADVYDAEKYQEWLRYYKEKSRLHMIRHLITVLVVYVVLAVDLYANVVRWLSVEGDYIAAFVILIADMLISRIYGIPVEYADTMGIEQKYGFNKTTRKTFFLDQIKNMVIELVLLGGLCCLLIFLHKALGNWLIPVFGGIVFLLILLISFLAPTFSKIFNKFEPLPEGELRDALCRLLESNGCVVKEIKVMDGSRRSTKANAYFSGFGKTKTIVLYDTLLEQMTNEEIIAVFAHEMGHNKHRDTLKMVFMNAVNIAIMVVIVWALISVPEIYKDFGFDGVNYGFAFFLLGTVCLSFLSPFTELFTSSVSRRFEYKADRFAKECGYGKHLVSALKVLARNSFVCLTPHPLVVKLTYSHPTISQRIEALEAGE